MILIWGSKEKNNICNRLKFNLILIFLDRKYLSWKWTKIWIKNLLKNKKKNKLKKVHLENQVKKNLKFFLIHRRSWSLNLYKYKFSLNLNPNLHDNNTNFCRILKK